MTKIVQISRDVADTINQYVGPEGEITATTDSKELRLHDGVTPGGVRFLRKDVNDQLYQKRSTELDTLSTLGIIKGILVRTGDAAYLIRKILGTVNEIDVANPDGFAGDIKVGLAATIDKAITFIQGITFSGGITGDVNGNVTGNLTGNVTGDADGDHTGSFTGDVDVRGSQLLLDDGQIPLAKLAVAVAPAGDPGVLTPTVNGSFILMWSGAVANIPAGWRLCDGTGGTPDLRDKFIRGAGGASNPGATGGSDTHGHNASSAANGDHAHTITVDDHTLSLNEIPGHYHMSGIGMNDVSIPINGYDPTTGNGRFDQNNNSRAIQARTSAVGGGQPHGHNAASGTNGSHAHTITVANGSTLPAYYALCFIMRI